MCVNSDWDIYMSYSCVQHHNTKVQYTDKSLTTPLYIRVPCAEVGCLRRCSDNSHISLLNEPPEV